VSTVDLGEASLVVAKVRMWPRRPAQSMSWQGREVGANDEAIC
jgi:hypothetical protein